jgi:hypothetical protein
VLEAGQGVVGGDQKALGTGHWALVENQSQEP